MRYPLAAVAGALTITAAVFALERTGSDHAVEQKADSRRVTHDGISFEPPEGWSYNSFASPRGGGKVGLVSTTGGTITLLRGREVPTTGWQEIEVGGRKAFQFDRETGPRFIRQVLIQGWGTVALDTQVTNRQQVLPLFEAMVRSIRVE